MKRFALTVTLLLVVVAARKEAHALAGLLSTPGIANTSGSSSEGVGKVLQSDKYKYVTGSYINWVSKLYYSGKAKDLSSFVNELALIQGAEVNVRFSREKGWVDTTVFGKAGKSARCDWLLTHHGNSFGVTVFLGGDEFDLENLRLPPLKPDPSTVKPPKSIVEIPKLNKP